MRTGLIVVSIVGVLLALWLFRRSGVHPVEQSQIPEDPDGQVLKQLVAAGSDLSKPHEVEFFLYFPDEERASRAYRDLAAEGYSGKVDRAAKGPGWLCFVTRQIVPSHSTMLAIRSRMEGLAKEGSGEYDGWGTEITR
jgi:Regulator of ribonuclease activity B